MTARKSRSVLADDYLQILGLARREPDLEFLNEITRRHVARFAFSSVGPLLGDELPLDFESLYQRIIINRRGGYCFEQNGLLFELLEEYGFSVNLYLGRVIYNQDIHPGLTHRITLVDIDGERYVADVGFGPLGPASAVNLSGQRSVDGFRTFRIAERDPGVFHMQTLKDGSFFSLYKFELASYGQADCEVGHFYSHKHPAASFVNHLVVSRIQLDEVCAIRNHEYSVNRDGAETRQIISSAKQLRALLDSRFKIKASHAECERLFSKSA
jgi:N-hydroxyarylamine O-acetyltransferase